MNDNDVVLEPAEDAPSGMPTGAPAPPPDLTQPLAPQLPDDPGPTDEDAGAVDDAELDAALEPGAPAPRRGLVGDLVREREQRRVAENQAQHAQDLLRTLMADKEGAAILQRIVAGEPAGNDEAAQQAQLDAQAEQEATAIDLGLYDEQGRPDLDAAARIMAREERRVQAQVQRAVNQLKQTELAPLQAQRTEGIIQHVIGVAQGYGIDPVLVERGLRSLPPDQITSTEVQQTVLMTALGLQTFGQGGQPAVDGGAPPRGPQARVPRTTQRQLRPPMFTEPAGGRVRNAPALDDAFRSRLRESGLKDEEINTSLGRFVPGAPNRLE